MKQKIIIYGEKIEKVYYFSYWSSDSITLYDKKHLEWIGIFEGEIEDPPFVVDDNVFIPSLNQSVKVIKTARNLDGGYVYWTNYITEEIENTESRLKVEKRMEEIIENDKKQTDDSINKALLQLNEKNRKKWFMRYSKK
ncbi:hypothetical protein [Paenibacillus pini]|uniref:hypothetical protein n=1 Tax=Paenibacillus pini TaxID=669461 RepID=UPI000566880C|nr:hypothetical protein [Paenibacillus pini]